MNYLATTTDATASAIFSGIFCCFSIFMTLFGIAIFALWIYAIIDCITRNEKDFGDGNNSDKKVLWLLIIILGSWIGAAIYYFLVIRKYKRS